MSNAFERLAKVLELERRGGFRNRAVIGGLEKFLPGWASTAVTETGGAALAARVHAALAGYADKSPDERAQIVKALLAAERPRGGEPDQSGPREPAAPTPPPSRAEGKGATAPPARREGGPSSFAGEKGQQLKPLLSKGDKRPQAARPAPSKAEPGRAGGPVASDPHTPLADKARRLPASPPSPQARSEEGKPVQPTDESKARDQRPPAPLTPPLPPATGTGSGESSGAGAPAVENKSPTAGKPLAPPALLGRPTPPKSPARPPTDEGEPMTEGAPALSLSAAPVAVADPPPMPRVQTPRRGPASTISATGNLDGPVTQIPGVSSVYAKHLARLNVQTIRDMLFLVPRRYDDFSRLKTIHQLMYGEEATVVATVQTTTNRRTNKGMTITESLVSDSTGALRVTFFNQPYLLQQLRPGRQVVLSGRIDSYLGKLVLQSPEWEQLDQELIHTGRLVPVYPLTQGIGGRWMRNTMKRVVDAYAPKLDDPLPAAIRESYQLMPLGDAVRQTHFPDNAAVLSQARQRLAFDEFFVIQLGVLRQRRRWQSNEGRPLPPDEATLHSFLSALPFSLTAAQQRVLQDILRDMREARPMSRLLQGDVGSGKTVVAAAAMVAAHTHGVQSALMVPTEILAEQHAKSLRRLMTRWAEATDHPPLDVALLTGSQTKAEREAALTAITSGETPFIVGTHAVIQSGVEFKDLGLAVVDEQHRFGVEQRSALRQKGAQAVPHLLVMTATPIPRTLALTLYGDLDLSIIDELPPGRTPIKTKWVLPRERERAYSFVDSQIKQGRQAFVICPLIEESETTEAKAAVQEYERLQGEVFPHLRLGLLHGKMKSSEKDRVMGEFYRGEIDILVSTSVVEVGIDVPNATVMLIEGANRFGLAQLHQFRGRVGRGEHASFCLLVADEPVSEEGRTRLEAMERTQDGFELAEEDLKLRGPGEFFGTRQSGLPDLAVAKLSDVKTLELARQAAEGVFAADPDFDAPEHAGLRAAVDKFWSGQGDLS